VTKRSRKYFQRKRRTNQADAALASLIPIEAYHMCMDAMKKIAKPIATYKYPPGAPATIGENGPEIIETPGGLRIYPKLTGTPFANGTDIIREGMYDVVIENAFTPYAKTTVTKIVHHD